MAGGDLIKPSGAREDAVGFGDTDGSEGRLFEVGGKRFIEAEMEEVLPLGCPSSGVEVVWAVGDVVQRSVGIGKAAEGGKNHG